MDKKLTYLSIFCCGVVTLGLLFRETLLFGSLLISARWLIFIFLVTSIIKSSRHRLLFSFFFFAAISEWIYTIYNYHSQDYYVFKSKKEFVILNHNLLYKSKPKENYLDSVFKKEVDFLAFQEFNSNWRKYLASKATLNYKYFADIAHDYDAYGFGFYSKYPILKTTYLQEYKGVPYCQIIDILIDKDTLTVFNTHLDSPAIAIYGEGNFWTLLFDNHRRRRKQYNSILALSLKKGTKKQIFCGDFNTTRVEPLYRTMHLNWKNAATKRKGDSFSFKIANSPAFIAIDHVFYRGKLNNMNSEIYSFGNSDHLPTVTRFEH